MVVARGRSLTPPVGGRGSGGATPSWPPHPRRPPGGAARSPGARASGRGRPGGGHGPLRVDQRPPGDQRDAGDPAARGARLRRRGEGRAEAAPPRGPSCWARHGLVLGPGLPASTSRPAVHGGLWSRGAGDRRWGGGSEPRTVQFRLVGVAPPERLPPPSCGMDG